jgi:drug/metabolite transporter (DMT)-like permease
MGAPVSQETRGEAQSTRRLGDRRLAGVAVMLLAMLLFAWLDASNKWLSQGYAIAEIMLVRYALFCAVALWLARGSLRAFMRSRRPYLQAMRALLLVLEMAAFVFALRYLPLADVHAIAAVTPLLVTAFSLPMLGERVRPRQWAAVLIGFVGVLVIVRPGFAQLDWAIALPIVGALLFAIYQILLRMVARDDPPPTTVLYSAFVGLAAMLVPGSLEWRTPAGADWLWFACAGLFGSLAHLAMTRALDLAPAAVLQPFGYTLMVWAALLGWLVFGQFPDLWTIAGAAIVTAGGLYGWLAERRQEA